MLRKLKLYFNTIKYLKVIQIYYRIYYLVITKSGLKNVQFLRLKKSQANFNCQNFNNSFCKPISKLILINNNHATFLNKTYDISNKTIWNSDIPNKLWLYNLHYFDILKQDNPTTVDIEANLKLINRWISENPIEKMGNGWEPYPLSLRIVNFIKFQLLTDSFDRTILNNLYIKSKCLYQQIEYHILGNHIFANAKALIFAGLFFDSIESSKWLKKGIKILENEIREQILDDGGHFELSPMYHIIILEDILDLINIFSTYEYKIKIDLKSIVKKMINWLAAMTHPDGRISFFNDSAFNIAPTIVELTSYAKRLGIDSKISQNKPMILRNSGYYVFANDLYKLIIDAGNIGPDYLPGHAHADTLSFELSWKGTRLFVNSGTYTYQEPELRHFLRKTEAHNCLAINNDDSSEIWQSFRVAKRAKLKSLHFDDKNKILQAEHDGYLKSTHNSSHTRKFVVDETCNSISIIDSVQSKKSTASNLYFHLYPGYAANIQNNTVNILMDANVVAVIHFDCNNIDEIKILGSNFYPEFGARKQNLKIVVTTKQCKVLNLRSCISLF